ncbi:MAG: glutamyl-tRNA reductase [Chthoniobacteraceae bacterium]|nr:glutamyl-tRNA reductase [Chthoniobacteraceae bacterium]
MQILCLGLSHQTAAVETRERFAIPDTELARALGTLGSLPGIAETAIVSTCNRVEFYAAATDVHAAMCSLLQFAAERGKCAPVVPKPFYALKGEAALGHLFRVVSGLESMVIGETEILGQVKKAYAAAAAAGSTGRNLNKFFQRAFNVAKEVRTSPAITRGPVSVGSVTVDLAEKIFGKLAACRAMILGAGETSELTAKALLSRGVKSIFVANRTFERAASLAAAMGGEAIRFDEAARRYPEIDILISSTAAPHAVVTRAQIAPVLRQRSGRPLFLIDLAVPRDIEPCVNDLDGAFLYDIDSLQAIAHQGMEVRRKEIARCETLIARHVGDFHAWLTTGRPLPSHAEPGTAEPSLNPAAS